MISSAGRHVVIDVNVVFGSATQSQHAQKSQRHISLHLRFSCASSKDAAVVDESPTEGGFTALSLHSGGRSKRNSSPNRKRRHEKRYFDAKRDFFADPDQMRRLNVNVTPDAVFLHDANFRESTDE